jgi:thiol-disulfide isomerase/thioredoxin
MKYPGNKTARKVFSATSLGLLLCFSASTQALDFELARIEGSSFVRLSELPPRLTLVNFWRADCPPCVAELPLLLDAAPRLGFRLVTVSLQTLAETRAHWPRVPGAPDDHVALLGPPEPRGLLRRFGNRSGAIPYSVLLRKDGSLCAAHSGEISAAWLVKNLEICDGAGHAPP